MILLSKIADQVDKKVREVSPILDEMRLAYETRNVSPKSFIYDSRREATLRPAPITCLNDAKLLFACQRAIDIYYCAGLTQAAVTNPALIARTYNELQKSLAEIEDKARHPCGSPDALAVRWLAVSQRVRQRQLAVAAGEAPQENVALLNELVTCLARYIGGHENADSIKSFFPPQSLMLLEEILELKHRPCDSSLRVCLPGAAGIRMLPAPRPPQ